MIPMRRQMESPETARPQRDLRDGPDGVRRERVFLSLDNCICLELGGNNNHSSE